LVLVELVARMHLEHEDVDRLPRISKALKLANRVPHRGCGEIQCRLPQRVAVAGVGIDPYDATVIYAYEQRTTIGVREADQILGEVSGVDPSTLSFEPLVLTLVDDGTGIGLKMVPLLVRRAIHLTDSHALCSDAP
jgi:hypothetical protein